MFWFGAAVGGFICLMLGWMMPEPQWSKDLKAWVRSKLPSFPQ